MARRFAVVGNSGSGKTTLALEIAARTGAAHVEIDALYLQAGWRTLPEDELRARIDGACPADGHWVIDGNYGARGGDLARSRAEVVVWLDLPRAVVMRRVIARTLRRGLRREVLFNGNRESLLRAFSRRPERNIILWAWTRHAHYRALYAAEADGRWVRLTTPAAVAAWTAKIG